MAITWKKVAYEADVITKAFMAAKGDLISASDNDTPLILTVGGTNGHVLTVDSGEATGLKWAAAAGGGGGLAYEVISANDTAASGEGFLIDASGGAIVLTLPATPSAGDTVGAVDAYNKATTNTITIARNGENIEGAAEDLIIDVDGAGFVLVYCDATRGWEIVSEVGNELGTEAYVKVSDVKAYNAGGGTFTQDAWRTRVINTEDSDADSICAISSNQITLQPGTYICQISCPAYLVNAHFTRLYNITATEVTLSGTSEYAQTAVNVSNRSVISGRFTIAAATIFEVQHYCKLTSATLGLGFYSNTAGVNSIYTIAEFWRL